MQAVLLIAAILLLAVLLVLIPTSWYLWQRLRGPRVVVCPETRQPTEVELDARAAAVANALKGRAELRIQYCERWLEGQTCDEACLEGIDEAMAAEHAILSRSPLASRRYATAERARGDSSAA